MNNTKLTVGDVTDVDISLMAVDESRTYTAVVNTRNPVDILIVPQGNMAKVKLYGYGLEEPIVSEGSSIFENLELNEVDDTVFTFEIMSYDGQVVGDPYEIVIKYVENTDTSLKSVVFDGIKAEKLDFDSSTYAVRADSFLKNGILTITASNENAVITLGDDTSENGILNVSYNLTGNVSKVDFTVTAENGINFKDYTLYIIKNDTGVNEIYVNGTKVSKTDNGYVYEVPFDAKAADIRVVAESEISMVQIGSFDARIGEDTKTVTLQGATTEIPVNIYSYPYGENNVISETVKIVKKDISLSLSSVYVKSESETEYTQISPDKYGNYLAAIPADDSKASVVIASRVTADIGLIRVVDGSNEVIAEGTGQISAENIPDLTDENLFYIVLNNGKDTNRYELKIVKESGNTKVQYVIAERGTEDEYIAADAECGGGSEIVPEEPDGSEKYPYEISTPEDLQSISNDLDAHYVITENIDMNGFDWTPIGTPDSPFTGTLKGNGKTISNLNINASVSGGSYGMFGINKGTVENIKIENVTITSVSGTDNQYIGAVAGKNEEGAQISKVAVSSGDIHSSYIAGGIVGENRGTINNSYNKAKVSSVKYAAGIAGWNNGTIENVYSVGTISTQEISSIDDYVAGITVSNRVNAVIRNAFTILTYQICNKNTSNLNVFNSASVIPEKLKNQDTFSGWDFTDVWTLYDGQYPTLNGQDFDDDISDLDIPDGSEEHPFEITSPIGLNSIGNDAESLTKHYVIKNNISFTRADGSLIVAARPIGSEETPFTGTIDGQGYTISGFNITDAVTVGGEDYSAIIPVNNGTIKNLIVSPGTVGASGIENAAGIVGVNNGTISQVGISGGKITANNAAGIAIVNNGIIENSYVGATLLVSNKNSSGIVINNAQDGEINYVYSDADLSGALNNKASIAIDSDGLVSYSHSKFGVSFVLNKSLASQNHNSIVGEQMMSEQSTYEGWDFTEIWYMPGGNSLPKLIVTNHAEISMFGLGDVELMADNTVDCNHIVYIRDTKNSAKIYIKAQNPNATIQIQGGSYIGEFEDVITGLINDRTEIPL